MFKFGFGAVLGFAGGALFVSKMMIDVFKRDGSLKELEAIILKNLRQQEQRKNPKIDINFEGNTSTMDNLEAELKRILHDRP